MRNAVDRNVPLLHCFEHRRLGFGRRAVDLVGKDQAGEDRASFQVEPAIGLVVDAGTEDIGRHQVRRKLDSGETHAADSGERANSECLSGAGNPFQKR